MKLKKVKVNDYIVFIHDLSFQPNFIIYLIMFSFDDKTLRNFNIFENQKNIQKNIDQSTDWTLVCQKSTEYYLT